MNRVSLGTMCKHRRAIVTVLWFLFAVLGDPIPANFLQLDDSLQELIESLWLDGEPLSFAEQCIASTQHYISGARGHLKGCWLLLSTWKRLEPPVRTPPWPRRLAVAVAGGLLELGFKSYALAILLGYDCVLRTIELTSVRTSHLLEMRGKIMIYLGVCKTGHRDNRLDAVKVEDLTLCPIVCQYLKFHGYKDFPLVSDARHFRQTIKHVLGLLGFIDAGLQLYGVRRGGATSTFIRTSSYDAVAERGRWASHKAMKTYINEAMKCMAEEKYTDDTTKKIKQFGAFKPELFYT